MSGPTEGPLEGLASALAREEESLLTCVHCGFCLPACPTYVRLGDEADSPRGRLYLMRALVEGRISPDSPALHTHLDRCLGCRACEPVCPSGVPYGHLLERAREVVLDQHPAPVSVRLLLALFREPRSTRVAMALGRAIRASGLPALLARVLPRPMRLPAAMLASTRAPDLSRLPSAGAAGEASGRPGATASGASGRAASAQAATSPRPEPDDGPNRVGILTGCVQQGLLGRINEATERTLRANGYEVTRVPGQGCCGALHAHAGDLEGARSLARRNVRAFGTAGIDLLCVNAAGCGAVLREYGELLADDAELAPEAETLSGRVRDVTELLAARGPRSGSGISVRVAYDPPCHLLHAQGVAEAPLRVLDAIPGVVRRPVERASECCGGAGVYGMTHPELGGRIGRDKVEALRGADADVVATGNPGCAMQIGATMRLSGARLPVVHPVELLDESYRRAGIYERGRGARGRDDV